MQTRAITADDFITEVQFLQSRATHYWRKAVEKLEKLERFAFQLIFLHCLLIAVHFHRSCFVICL